jgi:NAD(P)-dependent dehydrogenase (short-subunit alcohol dehydrogenase family)
MTAPTDVADSDAVARLVERTTNQWGRRDLPATTPPEAAIPPTPPADVDAESFDSAFAVDLRGVFLAMK